MHKDSLRGSVSYSAELQQLYKLITEYQKVSQIFFKIKN